MAIAGLMVLLPVAMLGAGEQRQADTGAGSTTGTPVVSDTKIPSDLRNCPFEERGTFVGALTVKHARLASEIDRLRGHHVEALASEKKKAAMAELAAAETNFEPKLDEVNSATAETWNAARDNVAASFDDLQAAYTRALEAR